MSGLLLVSLLNVLVLILIHIGFRWYWPTADQLSYIGGFLHMFSIAMFAFTLPRVYGYFIRHGWAASPRDWWQRFHVGVTNDWRHDARGIDIDVLRVQFDRNRTKGSAHYSLAVLGIHFHLGVIVDMTEAARFKAAAEAEREAYLAKMPKEVREAMRNMISQVPLDAQIEVNALRINPSFGDDDDDDDDKGGGVH